MPSGSTALFPRRVVQSVPRVPNIANIPHHRVCRGGHIGRSKEHLFRTVNFGAALGMRAGPALDILAAVQPKMPLTAMELWCGWFDHWGAPSHAKVRAKVS